MATIYLVTSGCYSNYTVDAAFSTLELANQYVAECNKRHSNFGFQVEEFEIDRQATARVMTVYETTIDLHTGELSDRNQVEMLFGPDSNSAVAQIHKCHFSYSPESQEHADKLAIEARQEWLRMYGPAVTAVESA